MKTNLSLKDELLSAIRRIVAKFWAQVVGRSMRLQSVCYHANLSTKIGIKSRIVSKTLVSTLLLLSICTGNTWGADPTETVSIATIASANSWTNGSHYSGWTSSSGKFTFTAANTGQGLYYSSDNSWRGYNSKGAMVITAGSGVTIKSVTSSPSKTWSVSGSGAGNSASFTPTATTKFTSFTITYTEAASCTTKPTVGSDLTSVSATVNSITATVPISSIGGCNITENGLVYSSSVNTPTVGAANCYTATTTACGGTAANKTVTISDLTCGTPYYVRGYAINGAGTQYTTNTKTQATSACPKYTVTLKDDDTELEQATAGASVDLPSRAGCTGYTFAGWTKSWTSAQSSWTTTAPTIIPAGSYTPTDDEDLYPVYTKTEGGGDPVSVSGGDMADGVGTTGWTTSGTGTYSGNGVKFDGANDYIQSPDLSSNSFKEVTVKYKAGHNGGSGSVLTFASLDGSGNVIDSETATPTEAYDSQSTTYSLTLSGSTVIKYVRVTMTSKTKNLGMKYCEVFVSGSTTYYISVPGCCTSPETELSITSANSVATGGTVSLTSTGGNEGSVTWSVVNGTGSASIVGTTLTGGTVGTVTVKAHQDANGSYCAQDAEQAFTVVASTVPVTGVSVVPTTKAIVVGETFTITPTVAPADATDKSVSWTSSATGKATVTSGGVVEGVAAGSATITCTTTDGGKTATTSVSVYSVTVNKKDDTGTAISADGVTATAAGRTLSAGVGSTKYVFKEWQATTAAGLAISSTTSANATLTGTPTGNVTITAVFYKPRTVAVSSVDDVTISATPSGSSAITENSSNSDVAKGTTVTLNYSSLTAHHSLTWKVHKTGDESTTVEVSGSGDGATFAMPAYDVTVSATISEDTYHYVTFKNDGAVISGYENVKTYDGTKPSAPTLTDVTDACDKTECNKFYGWITEAGIWDETIDDVSAKTIYRSASTLPEVSGSDVVYHAVWAAGEGSPEITLPTPLIYWERQSISASTDISATSGTGKLNSTVAFTDGTYDKVYNSSTLTSYPTVTLSNLVMSGATGNTVSISFYTRGTNASAGTMTVKYTDGDVEYTAGTVAVESKLIRYHEVTGIPKTATQIKLVHGANGGNLAIGTIKIFEPKTTSYTFTELTSSNTDGWTNSDWDGYFLITGDGSTQALDGNAIGDKNFAAVEAISSQITTTNIGAAFKVTYVSGEGYKIQGVGSGDYLNTASNSVASSSSVVYLPTISYNTITDNSSNTLKWNSTKFGFYASAGTALTIYKILETFSKFRISCCEKYDINLSSSGSVEGGTFSTTPESACEGQEVTLNLLTTNSGYNISSWTVTGTVSGDEVSVTGSDDGATFAMPGEAVTVTAVFASAHTTTVTLNAQGGTSGTSSVTATVNLPMPAATMPTKTGYTFGGYYSATNGSGTQYYDADGNSSHVWDDSENDAATLYAKWTSSGYTVTLNTEGGSGGTASVTVYYGVNTNLTSAITCPTKANNVFGGYFTSAGGAGTQLIDADGNWLPSVTSYTDVTKQWLYANDLELHAKWTSVSYTNYRTTCGPEIELEGGPVYLTSYANCEVLTPSTGLITVSSDAWGSTAVSPKFLKFTLKDKNGGTTYSHTSSNIASSEFRVYNADGNGSSYADGSYFAIPTGTTGAATYNFRIAYKPAASVYNTLDHYVLEVEVMDNSTPTKKAITMETMDLYGRTLPEQFVIAVKKDGQWYALPNDLASTAETAKATAAIPIVVDNATTPTSAVFAPENVLYKVTQYYDGPAVANRNRSGIRFTRNGSQYLQVSTTPANNNMWLSSTGGTDVQDWYLNSSTFGAYEVKIDPRVGSGGYKDKKIGMYGSNFGFYSSPTASDIYFLPVIGVLEEASVTEWGKNSVILEVDARSYSKVIARVGDVATGTLAFSETQSSKGNTSKYNYSINLGNTIDLTTKKGQLLYFDWINAEGNVSGSSMVTIPWLIAGEGGTMSTIDGTKGHWETEVHVLPGATLTADAGTFSGVTIKHLEIYPGATVKVTTGTLTASTLVLRNGWTRAVSKSYDVARLYIDGSASMTKPTNAYADWYIDYDQYYPIAVPWTVTTSGMSYKNSNSAASAGVKLRYYDGKSRAENGQSGVGSGTNWKEYSPLPTTLKPGRGYAMTAKRPTGKAFSIVRMPLTIPSADWTTGGEKGEVSSTHKDTVSVKAYGVSDESKPRYTVGWNFIANPYMSIYQGPITHSEGSYYDIEYVNIPDTEFKEYAQYPVGTEQRKLLPASGFLIQTDQDGVLTFGTTNRQASAPSYRNESTTVTYSKQKAYIVLTDEQTEDMMGILVSEKYTADYELNADLEKLLSDGNTLRTYMRYNDMNMAYLAINEELAKQLIPVSVRIPADGEYTFKIHEASIADELEGIYLTDYQTNTVTNLLYDSYTFNAVAGTDNARFAINAVIGKREVPTGVDISGSDKDKPTKFIWNDKVYILHNNVIYDSTGKRVNVINK